MMESLAPFVQDLLNHVAELAGFFIIAMMSVSVGKIQRWLKDRPARKFEKDINGNVKVRELLAEFRVLYEADRVGLWQFSNGSYYLGGGPVMKCSLTHYVTRTGLASPSVFQTVETNHMLPTVKALQEKGVCQFAHLEVQDDSFQETLFAATGNSTILCSAVRDPRSNWVGILVAAFMSERPPVESQENIKSYGEQIGEFLYNNS